MNRGFAYYFGRALKTALTVIWKNHNVLKSVAYLFMGFGATLTCVFRPMLAMAAVTQAKTAERRGDYVVAPAFSEACKPLPFWTMFMACVLETLIMLGGYLLCGIIIAALVFVAMAMAYASAATATATITLIALFSAPGVLITLLYASVMGIIFSPTAYVVESNPGITAAEVVSVCFNTMKPNGKLIVFLTHLITIGIELVVALICLGVTALIYAAMPAGAVKLFVICVWLIASLAIVSLTLPTCLLAKNIALKNLFEDIAQDPVNASKRTAGINITNITGAEFEYETIHDKLVDMFDETHDDSIPLPSKKAQGKARTEIERGMVEGAKHQKKEKKAKPPMDKNVDEKIEGKSLDEVPTQAAPPGVTFEQQPAPAPAPVNFAAPSAGSEPASAPAPFASAPTPPPVAEQPAPAPNPFANAATPNAAPNPFASAPTPPPVAEQPAPAPNPFANAGTPNAAPNPFASAPTPPPVAEQPAPAPNPFANAGTPNPAPNPFANAGTPNPAPNPFANAGTPNPAPNPFANAGTPNPAPNPFANAGTPNPAPNPFANAGAPNNPFAQGAAGRSPFGAAGAANPFASTPPVNPFGGAAGAAGRVPNPFEQNRANTAAEQTPNGAPTGGNGTGNGGEV